jgi:hypothetical protein
MQNQFFPLFHAKLGWVKKVCKLHDGGGGGGYKGQGGNNRWKLSGFWFRGKTRLCGLSLSLHLSAIHRLLAHYSMLSDPFTYSSSWRMLSSGVLHNEAVLGTDVSEERITSIIRLTRICELGTTLAVTSNWRRLRRNTISHSNITEDNILHSHRRGNLKSYIALTGWAL